METATETSAGLPESTYFTSETGLVAQATEASIFYKAQKLEGNDLPFDQNRYTRLDFFPGGRTNTDPSKRRESIRELVTGLRGLVSYHEEHPDTLPELLIGRTEQLDMAAIMVKQFGFKYTDSSKPNIENNVPSKVIVGNISEVKTRLKKITRL